MKNWWGFDKILNELAYIRMHRIMKKRPLDINVETINKCPLKCVFCCNRIYKRENTVMDNKLFEDIVRQYCEMGGGAIGLGSMQSDFFSDALLLDRIRILKKYKNKYKNHLWVYTTTSLVSLKKYSDMELAFILRQFDCLQISVEGHDKESYQKMSGIDGFSVVCEQLKRVSKYIKDYSSSIRIDIYFRTYNRDNLLKSSIYSELKRDFNIYNIRDTFFSWFGTIKQKDLPDGAKVVYKLNEGLKVNCSNPSVSLSIMADGKVVGCGCIDWLGKYVIGDCKRTALKEIWNSPKSIKFRKAFSMGKGKKLPSICRECALYSPIHCMKNKKYLSYKLTDGLHYLWNRSCCENRE